MTKDTRRAVALGILAILLIAAIPLAIWGIRVATADTVGAGNQKIATQADVDYRIAAYDQFFDACAAIQAKEDAIAVQADLQAAYPEGSADYIRLQTNIAALTASRAALIRAYNADAAKADTRGHFLASNLPYSIDPNQEHTACAS